MGTEIVLGKRKVLHMVMMVVQFFLSIVPQPEETYLCEVSNFATCSS